MDFFKLKKFKNVPKPNLDNVPQDPPVPQPEQAETVPTDLHGISVNVESNNNTEMENDEDDFITNELTRRLMELRRNSCLGSIPEEPDNEDEEEEEEEEEQEGGTTSNEWRDVEAEGRQFWFGFYAVYAIYCERMLFFDRLSSQQLLEAGSRVRPAPSQRSASKKLPSPLRCLNLRKHDFPKDETEQLQQPIRDPSQDLETAYVAQACLSWEALHCQYTHLTQIISNQPEIITSYNHSAQSFQQFQVLLQRFIENEPFEVGSRPEIYAQARRSFPNLLQVPKIQGSDENNVEDGTSNIILASDLTVIIENSILSFRQFIKKEKKKPNGARMLFGNQNHVPTPVQQVRSSLEKKSKRLKELWKTSKSYNKKSWPITSQDVEILLGLIDVKLASRVLRMSTISDQLLWCEEKMKKLDLSDGKLQRDPSPIFFPLLVGQ